MSEAKSPVTDKKAFCTLLKLMMMFVLFSLDKSNRHTLVNCKSDVHLCAHIQSYTRFSSVTFILYVLTLKNKIG